MKSALAFATVLTGLALAATAAPAHAAEPEAATVENAASTDSISQIVTAVESRYAKVQTIQAKFTQVKKDAFGTVSQDGDVVVARPTKMRWRFLTGDEQIFATDGETLTIYAKADNYYQQMPDSTSGSDSVQGFLTSLDRLDEIFEVSLVDGGLTADAGPTLHLVPRKPGAVASIRLDLDKALIVEQVVMTDSYGNVTDLTFSEVVYDKPIDDAIFKFAQSDAATDR